jgi:hypothetical protein
VRVAKYRALKHHPSIRVIMYKNHLKVMIEKRRTINKYVVPNTVWRILVLVEIRMTSAGCTRKYTAKSSNISCQC